MREKEEHRAARLCGDAFQIQTEDSECQGVPLCCVQQNLETPQIFSIAE